MTTCLCLCRAVQGFGLYLVLTGKNFIYEAKTEARYRDLLIVCNVQPSSGPLDMEGLLYRINGVGTRIGATESTNAQQQQQQRGNSRGPAAAAKKTMEEFEEGMDEELFLRKGVVRSNANPKCKNKVGFGFLAIVPGISLAS